MRLEEAEGIAEEYKTLSAAFLAKNTYFKGDYSGELIWSVGGNTVGQTKIISDIIKRIGILISAPAPT
jgi:hypothetical protein